MLRKECLASADMCGMHRPVLTERVVLPGVSVVTIQHGVETRYHQICDLPTRVLCDDRYSPST